MVDSTLPVWAAILLFGGILLYLLSYVNIYIPKDQKEKAKNMRTKLMQDDADDADIFVVYRNRFEGLWYLVIPGFLVLLPASIAFFISDFPNLVCEMSSLGIFGRVIAFVIFLFGFFFAELIGVVLMFTGEEMAIAGEKTYYSKRYGVILISQEEYDRWLKH